MITLSSGQTLSGKAGTASVITYTVMADLITTTDTFAPTQGQLAAAAATIYTSTGGASLVKEILLANTTSSDVTNCVLYAIGTAAANQLTGTFTVPANGTAAYSNGQLSIYNSSGAVISSTAQSFQTGLLFASANTTYTDGATYNGFATVANGWPVEGLLSGYRSGITGTQRLQSDATANTYARYWNNGTTSWSTFTQYIDSQDFSAKGSLLAGTAASGYGELLVGTKGQVPVALSTAATGIQWQNLPYYDVTLYGVTQANTGAANTAAFNAMYAALPVNCTVYFPAGTYNFNGDLTINRNIQAKFFGDGKSRTILNNQSTTAHIFNISISAYYYTFEEFGFSSTVTKTAGAAIIASGDNAYLDVRRCEFKNQFISMDLSGVGAANVGTISECLMNSPAANGFQMRLNGANINTMITNCTINVTGVAAIGMEINQCGAVQVVGTEFIGGTNALRMNATGVLSAVFFTNCFFDQSTLGSTVKIMGTFAASRIKFVQCGITTGAANLSALEIAGTGTGTAIPEALDFVNCDFYNNSFTGTTNGILVTGARGLAFMNCRVSGFTNGFNFTSYSAAGVTNFDIQGCTIGPTENFSGNAVGILINAGSFTYGQSTITNNDLAGNTTAAIQNNGTYAAPMVISGNAGLAVAANPLVATPATIAAVETIVHQVPLPVNSLLPGTTIRFFACGNITGTTPSVLARIRLGTLGTATGDAALCATVAAVMTNSTGWEVEGFVTIRTVGVGTAIGQVRTFGEALATANRVSNQTATTAVTTTSANFATLTITGGGTAPVISVVQAYSVIDHQ